MGDVAPVIAVTGLKREGAVLHGGGVQVMAGGGAPERLASELSESAGSAAGIVSFGMAGALDPSLRVGEWVIAERLTGQFDSLCDREWAAALSRSLPSARIGNAYSDGRMIQDPAEKRALGARHAALIADMESCFAAQAATRANVPFAIVRCVSDTTEAILPPAVAVAMRAGGGLALGQIVNSIIAHPGQLPHLMRAVVQFCRAYSSLKAGAGAIGGRLAFDRR